MSDKVQIVTDEDFEAEVLKSAKPVLVDFWATWCGPCRMVAPVVEELAGEMPQVKFCKTDVDENGGYAGKLGIMSIPALIVFKDGEVVGKQIGAVSKGELKAFIENAIAD